jgi:hypothetical protein
MLNRRTFLATAAASSAWSMVRGATSAVPPLKIALATGVLERAVGCDVGEQIAAAARLGFRHFDDPQWSGRPVEEQQRIVQAARMYSVTLGPINGPTYSAKYWDCPRWQSACLRALQQAQAAGFRSVRVSIGPSLRTKPMICRFVTIWQNVADAVPGCDLLIEPWDDGRCGYRLFRDVVSALRFAKRSNLRLSVRTSDWVAAGYCFDELFDASDLLWCAGGVIGQVALSGNHPADNADLVSGLARLQRTGLDVSCGWGVSASPAELVAECRRLQAAVAMTNPPARDYA